MNRTRIEQETIINFNEGEDEASVYTFNPGLKRKLLTLSEERPEEVKPAGTHCPEGAVEYIIPKWWVRIRPSMVLSEEEKERRSAILKKARDKEN